MLCHGVDLQIIQSKIRELRGKKVILDFELAELYGVETKVLKQAVKRNIERFPLDFMFVVTKEEEIFLRSQFVTLENKGRGKYSKYLSFAFTEQGVSMLSSVLRSPTAIAVNIAIMRVFVQMRELAVTYEELKKQMDDHLKDYDELYYNIIGSEWDTVIGNITFTITMPKDFDSSKLGFSSGSTGSTDNSNIKYC